MSLTLKFQQLMEHSRNKAIREIFALRQLDAFFLEQQARFMSHRLA